MREKHDVRSLIHAAREIIDDAMDPGNDPSLLMDAAEQKIYEIRQGRQRGGLEHIRDVLASNYEMFSKLASSDRDQFVGIPSGIAALDELTTGLNRSDMIIVGARPGMGKTSFALNIARNVAVKSNRRWRSSTWKCRGSRWSTACSRRKRGYPSKKLRWAT